MSTASITLTTVSMVAASGGAVLALEDQPPRPATSANELLLKKLEAMERRIQMLEGELKQKQVPATAKPASGPAAPRLGGVYARAPSAGEPAPAPGRSVSSSNGPTLTANTTSSKGLLGVAESPVPGLSIGAYGEIFFGAMQNPAAGGQWQKGFDARRLVLLPTYQITDNIIFNAEIEFEHAGTAFDNDDKLHGAIDVEQLWIDFKIVDQFNWRAPGIDLVPIGYINQHHEPTQFYSVLRPELYNGLIPSTWKAPSSSIYGTITEGLKYQVMVLASNEDFGDSFDARTEAKTVPPPGTPYAAGITGLDGLGVSNPVRGDFQQLSNSTAVAGRLDFAPTFLPGFAGSVSAYWSPNTTPRGAHDDFGNFLGDSSLTMFDAEFRYRVPSTGFEFRGEYVKAIFGNPANLRANNDSDPTNNVGKTMWGASAEVAYHFPLGMIINSEWEAVPFYRYTVQNLQTGGFAGTDDNTPTGAGQRRFHTAGIAVFPSPKVVLKANYRKVISEEPGGAKSDSVLGGVGFFF